jgi:hypothetical protein
VSAFSTCLLKNSTLLFLPPNVTGPSTVGVHNRNGLL